MLHVVLKQNHRKHQCNGTTTSFISSRLTCLVLCTVAVQGKVPSIDKFLVDSTSYLPQKTYRYSCLSIDETMTSPLEPSSEIFPSSVVEDTAVGDTAVITSATNHATVEALTEEIAVEASHTATAASEEKEEETAIAKKKRRVTGEKRTRRVGIPSPRKDAKLEDPSQAGRDDHAYKVQSKHDEKWNKMLEALVEYKKEHNSTMVPQCYDQDQRLGRWVHYQRVEYWIYQTSGKGKINADRIARLEALGFEVRTIGFDGLLHYSSYRFLMLSPFIFLQWDPQRAQWNIMFEKLQEFAKDNAHCKVPKGYIKDPELANWVRNQRLEYANLQRNKKTRMTADRVDRLNEMGFKWSTAVPFRGSLADTIVKDAAVMAKTKHTPTGLKMVSETSPPLMTSLPALPLAAAYGISVPTTTTPALADNIGATLVTLAPKRKNEDGEEPLVMSV
jgi:hypothetical protein